MSKRNKLFLFLIFLISGFYYLIFFVDNKNEDNNFITEEVIVKKVIDGDTIELFDGRKIRMIGINTPEKGKFSSLESLNFTKNLENKTIIIMYRETDRYERILGYILFNNEIFNKKILEEGLAHLYYYKKDNFYDEMKEAEEFARQNKKGIWKQSKDKPCVSLLKFEYKEKTKRCNNEEILILNNSCNKTIFAFIKDDSTKHFYIELKKGLFSKNFSCVFNDDGDSLYIWDEEGLLLFYRYP